MIKTKFYLFLPFLLMVTLCLSFQSCGDDIDEPDSANTVKVTIEPVRVLGNYPLETGWNSLLTGWSKSGASFKVYVAQGSSITEVGTIHSNEKSVKESDSNLTLNVPIPSSVDTAVPYKIIAVDDGCGSKMNNGTILCGADLTRNYPLRVYAMYVADVGNGYISIASTQNITASECLYIKNYSGKKIKVKHKGYEATDKWYYTKANVRIANNNGISLNPEGLSLGQDVASTDSREIESDTTGFILSRFVPTGKKITNARLVLEIDGKEVKTPPVSSSMEIENGKPYFLRVAWDGTQLVWITDENKPDYEDGGNPSNGNN